MSGDTGPQPNPTPVPPGLEGNPEVIQKCTSLVQQFRERKISKGVAYGRIAQAIPSAFIEGGAGEQAVQAYVEILDQTEKELAEAATRGRRSSGGNGGNPEGDEHPESSTPDGRDRRPRGRSRSASPHAESSTKRRRVDDSKLP
jgi:hypothetical protein